MANPYDYLYNRMINKKIISEYGHNPIFNSSDDLVGLEYPKNRMVKRSKLNYINLIILIFTKNDSYEYYQTGEFLIFIFEYI